MYTVSKGDIPFDVAIHFQKFILRTHGSKRLPLYIHLIYQSTVFKRVWGGGGNQPT